MTQHIKLCIMCEYIYYIDFFDKLMRELIRNLVSELVGMSYSARYDEIYCMIKVHRERRVVPSSREARALSAPKCSFALLELRSLASHIFQPRIIVKESYHRFKRSRLLNEA